MESHKVPWFQSPLTRSSFYNPCSSKTSVAARSSSSRLRRCQGRRVAAYCPRLQPIRPWWSSCDDRDDRRTLHSWSWFFSFEDAKFEVFERFWNLWKLWKLWTPPSFNYFCRTCLDVWWCWFGYVWIVLIFFDLLLSNPGTWSIQVCLKIWYLQIKRNQYIEVF